jgi:alpha-ketoglutarate-dependent taurine dioxygenase
MEEHPEVGGDTAWVSGYGLYDELSPPMQKLLEGLHAVHTSRLQYDTTIVSTNFSLGFRSWHSTAQFPTPPSVKLYTEKQSGTPLYMQQSCGF